MRQKQPDNLIVDGYNIINAWPELIELKDNLEYARDKLAEIMAGYGAYRNYRVVVVFDAQFVASNENVRQLTDDLSVVFTGEGETADSYIEKMVYQMVKQGQRVYVVTSDWAEQLAILGSGAYRISARELLRDIKRVNKTIRERFTENVATYRRHELENRLSGDILKQLDEMRRKR